MQITIENPGQATLHLMRASALMRDKFNSMANCQACKEQLKQRYKDGADYLYTLALQVKENAGE